jgi:hypothetical protein
MNNVGNNVGNILILATIFVSFSLFFFKINEKFAVNKKTIRSLESFIEDSITGGFNETVSSPECCPSPYTNDRGCLCLDDNQKNMLMTRGNNRAGKGATSRHFDEY